MARLQRILLLLPLLASAIPAAAPVDPSSLLTIQARLDQEQKVSDSLRTQLDQARADAVSRVTGIRAASESIIHQLRTELDAANERARAAEALAGSKDSVIGEAREQAVKATETEAQAKAIAVIAVTARKASEVRQTAQHRETLAGLSDARSDSAAILETQRGIERLVADANARTLRIAEASRERAEQQKLTSQLQVIEACGGVLMILLLSLSLGLQIHRSY